MLTEQVISDDSYKISKAYDQAATKVLVSAFQGICARKKTIKRCSTWVVPYTGSSCPHYAFPFSRLRGPWLDKMVKEIPLSQWSKRGRGQFHTMAVDSFLSL